MVSKIHAFFRASQALGFGTDLCRNAERQSSLVRVFVSQRGNLLRLPRYLECFFGGALWRHTRTK